MEFSTILGFFFATLIIASSLFFGEEHLNIFDAYSLLIVLGGSIAVILVRFNFSQLWQALKGMKNLFLSKKQSLPELIITILELSKQTRKEGFLFLENYTYQNNFLKQGMLLVADGIDSDTIQTILTKDMVMNLERQIMTQQVFKALGEIAPAMGLIGTLLGLVKMLTHLNDPATLGPAMALAMLTTLYGAFIAHVIANPIAGKLALLSQHDMQLKTMIIDAVLCIKKKQHPKIIYDLLKSYLPKKEKLRKSTLPI